MSGKPKVQHRVSGSLQAVIALVILLMIVQLWLFTRTTMPAFYLSALACGGIWLLIGLFLRFERSALHARDQ
jgi:hypothetical protein